MSDIREPSREELWDLIKDIKFAMFTTHHDNGHLHSRPMTTQNASMDEDDALWFFMSQSKGPVVDLEYDDSVNVAYSDPKKDAYVSVSGRAEVVEDSAKKHELWNKMTEAWFPNGPDDPDVALVRVRITHAEYWNVTDNKLTQVFKMANAAATGKPPQDMGHHGKVRMN